MNNVTFSLARHERISLSTHCPVMIRVVTNGHYYEGEICRCDVLELKMKIHPSRCPSTYCPVRKSPDGTESGQMPKYELIKPLPK